MPHRAATAFALISASIMGCSLDGLTDGSAGATSSAGGAPTGGGDLGGGGGFGGEGGAGGEGGSGPTSAFAWIRSLGNAESQGTSPFASDFHGSSIRVSDPDPVTGAVWVAAVTVGAIDPDGGGEFTPGGQPEHRSLFVFELLDGELLQFNSFLGPLAAEASMSVDAVTRLDSGGVAVIGTFRLGSIELGEELGAMVQPSTDDGFVLLLDDTGAAVDAWQLTGVSNDFQQARGVAAVGSILYVAGRFKQSFDVRKPGDATPDPLCNYNIQADSIAPS